MKMKPKHRPRLLPVILFAIVSGMLLGVSDISAAELSVTAPAGDESHSFAIDLVIEESTPYAGIEFGLTLSSENALTFDSFTLGADVPGAAPYPFITSNGVHSFGFWTGTNAFGGNLKVGTLHFTYTGGDPQTITIRDMMVARVDLDSKTSAGTKKPSPAYVIHVSRGTGDSENPGDSESPGDTGGSGNPDGSGDQGGTGVVGGSGGSGGSGNPEIVIGIQDEETPLAAGNPFDDVKTADWFYDDVMYVYSNNLMNGTAADKFSPLTSTTRGMIVTVLYRAAGEPDTAGLAGPFDDVATGLYYTDAVKWGAKNEVILGYGDGSFGPNDDITREQLAAIFYRYEQFSGKTPPSAAPGMTFADENGISDYAKTPVNALVTQGIITGRPNNIFDPKGKATRAEVAAVLHRFSEATE